jgi:hypothetical protein
MRTELEAQVCPGVYQHFKGGLYEVREVAILVDSNKQFVVYCKRDDRNTVFVREKREFVELIEVSGSPVPRFQLISPISSGVTPKQNGVHPCGLKVRHRKHYAKPTFRSLASSSVVR